MAITVDQVVEKYVLTRDEIASLEVELKEKLKPLKELQEKREAYLLKLMDEVGVQNMKSKHGTAYQTRKESVTVADWDTIFNWIVTGQRWEYLNKAVNKTAVLEEMGEERKNSVPPGVNYTAVRTINIRKG